MAQGMRNGMSSTEWAKKAQNGDYVEKLSKRTLVHYEIAKENNKFVHELW